MRRPFDDADPVTEPLGHVEDVGGEKTVRPASQYARINCFKG